jgi:hypothetical protein
MVRRSMKESWPLAQPAGERGGHHTGGHELVLDVDGALRTGDAVDEQRLGLAHLLLTMVTRLGARDRDLDVAEIGLDALRPGVSFRPQVGLAASGMAPATPGQQSQRTRGLAVDHHLDVVERAIGLARRIDASRVVGLVAARVPAADGDVETAREGQRIVDHHKLLVLGGTERDRRIEAEGDLRGHLPVEGEPRQRLALVRIDQRVVPEQQMNSKVRSQPDEFGQEGRQIGREPVRGRLLAHQLGPAVDVPTNDEDGAPRLQECLTYCGEERCAIDKHRRPARAFELPNRASGLKQRRHGAFNADGPAMIRRERQRKWERLARPLVHASCWSFSAVFCGRS